MIRVGNKMIPIGQLEDPSEPDESMDEWWERLHEAVANDLLNVLSCVLETVPNWRGQDEIISIIGKHIAVLSDEEFKNLVREIENA